MEHLRIPELVEFSAAKRFRRKLVGSEKIVVELLCYEPGQSTPAHQHPAQDEIFVILEGRGRLRSGEEEVPCEPNSLIRVPAGTPHGLTASERLIALIVKAPAFTSAVPPGSRQPPQ